MEKYLATNILKHYFSIKVDWWKKSNTITFDSWCMTCLAWVFLKAFHDVMKERICDVETTWLSSNEGDAMLHLIRYTTFCISCLYYQGHKQFRIILRFILTSFHRFSRRVERHRITLGSKKWKPGKHFQSIFLYF